MTSTEQHLLDRLIGLNIRTRRREKMMLRDDVASKLSVAVDLLAAYEHGSRTIPPEMLEKLATVLNVPLNSFFSGIESDEVHVLEDEFQECLGALILLRDRGALQLVTDFLRLAVNKTD